MGEVDLSSLSRAIARLEEAIDTFSADPSNIMIRDAVIKRFEFTYELCVSTLRRFIEAYSLDRRSNDRQTLPELIRTASQDGLVQSGWDTWHTYRDARNKTSHSYNEVQAIAVLAIVPAFLREADFLYHAMEKKSR